MSDDDTVTKIGVRFKAPPSPDDNRPIVEVVHYERERCNHAWFYVGDPMGGGSKMVSVTYLIREGETEIECSHCKTRLDPMWVLKKLASKDSEWRRHRELYQEEMKRLAERERTKCQHCGKMTRISGR